MSKNRIIEGKPIPLEMSDRYFQFNRQFAVRDVFDALVELITNSDDSYHRLYDRGEITQDGGPILIEYMEQRGGNPSFIRVRDRAEGMTLNEMVKKLGNVGAKVSEVGDRGFMARGAKDCTELGEMTIESIKEDRFYACQLTQRPELIPVEIGRHATDEDRELLGILRGNGTRVSLEIGIEHRMPRISTLIRDLPWHFALKDIAHEESPAKILIINLNDRNSSPEPITYRIPEASLVIDNLEFEINGYKDPDARLTLYRAEEPLEDPVDRRFRRSGLLVKGKRAIHECTLLRPEFESDPLASRYFGRIESPLIDILLNQYDELRELGEKFPISNPRLLIDPNRQQGLITEHPFTSALFQVPSERLRALISKDRDAQRKSRREIANHETKARLQKLARKASSFMKEQLEELGELSAGEEVDPRAFTERGILLVPTYIRLKKGDEKKVWLYVSKDLIESGGPKAQIDCEDEHFLSINQNEIELEKHPKKPDRYFGTFIITAKEVTDATYVSASVNGSPNVEAIVEINETGIETRDFSEPLEFEHSSYSVKEGRTRKLRLYAISPDLVDKETTIKTASSDSTSIAIRSSSSIRPLSGSNYALAEIIVQGRRLKSRSTISATVNGREASTEVRVVQKQDKGVPLEFEIRDEDFHNYRAIWADHEGKPNLLLISYRHSSLRRYLGPPPEFEGQDTPVFRLLLAEIVAESVCRKVLSLDATEHPWDYRLADYKDDKVIVDEVLARLHAKIREFVSDAHSIMLSDAELNIMSQLNSQ